MSKKLLIADTHLGLHKASDLYLNIVKDVFEEIKTTCQKHNIKEIIHLGDFFDDRKAINTKALDIAYQIVHLLEDFRLIIIIGNHDTYYKDSLKPTTLEALRKYENITIIDEITEHDNIVLCPWAQIPRGYKGGYCMGHFELIGFKMNNTFVCDRGQNPDELQNEFKHIYSGHFHTPSSKNNIIYLGSPFQMTMNDIGSSRGYYIWEDGELHFIEYIKAPKFIQFTTENINTSQIENNFIKLLFVEDYGTVKNQQIVDEIMSFKPQNLQVDFSGIQLSDENTAKLTEEATLLNHDEIITNYVEKIELPKHIKKKTLISMINKLQEDE